MMVHGMDSIQVQIVKAKALIRCTITEFVFPSQNKLPRFLEAITLSLKTIMQIILVKISLCTIVTLLYWMGFFLPVNAQISRNSFSIEIKSRSFFGPQNYRISMF
jgi:hypothetical protein